MIMAFFEQVKRLRTYMLNGCAEALNFINVKLDLST